PIFRLLEQVDTALDGLNRDSALQFLLGLRQRFVVVPTKLEHLHLASMREVRDTTRREAADMLGGYRHALFREVVLGKLHVFLPDRQAAVDHLTTPQHPYLPTAPKTPP